MNELKELLKDMEKASQIFTVGQTGTDYNKGLNDGFKFALDMLRTRESVNSQIK